MALTLTLAVLLGAAVSPGTASAATLDAKLVPSNGALWGIFSGPGRDGRTTSEEMPYLERLVGRTFDLDRWFYRWDGNWPAPREHTAVAEGRIPAIGWAAVRRDGSAVRWPSIANGNQDAVIRGRADAAKAFGHKMMVMIDAEPENQHATHGTAADYRAAWRRIVTIFRNRGVTNVVFVWNIMAYTFNPDGKSPEDYYPGDDVVDWVAADGYNWFGSDHVKNQPWREFKEIFASFQTWAKAKGKPAMIAEFGVLEDTATPDPQRKAEWFNNMAATLKNWPHVKAVTYYQGHEWPFDSSTAAINAFKSIGLDPYFSPRTSTADTTAPKVAVTNPADGSTVTAQSTVRMTASSTDDVQVADVKFWVNGALRCTDTVAPYTCDWKVETLPGASNQITAVSRDAAGNRAADTVNVQTGTDTTAPTVTITKPAAGSTVAYGTPVRIAATASDDVAVAKVEFWVNGILRCTTTLAPHVCDWVVWTARGKTNKIRAVAYDAVGNSAAHIVTVTTG